MREQQSDLFSDALEPIELESAAEAIRRAVTYLEQHSEIKNVYRVARGELHGRSVIVVAVCIDLSASFPPRYDPDEHGIFEEESVLFLFDAERYPEEAPHVGSDRRDFRWGGKPHISAAGAQTPPLFCLSRIPLNEWFAAHSFAEFYDRAVNWLVDAAHGRLQRTDGRFEPTMRWSPWAVVFDYEALSTKIQEQSSRSAPATTRPAQFEVLQPTQRDPSSVHLTFRFAGLASEGLAGRLAKQFEKQQAGRLARGVPGIVGWAPPGRVVPDTFSTLPQTREEIVEWAGSLGIDLKSPLEHMMRPYERVAISNYTRLVLFPILIAVERPTLLFGVESNVEIISFALAVDRIDRKEVVIPLQHQHPMTPERAHQLSQSSALDQPVVLFGAGAFGSKLFTHWFRSGHIDWTLVDRDILLPHNPIRHVLTASSVGLSKPLGLRQHVEGLFESVEETRHVKIVEKDLHDALQERSLRQRLSESVVIDATASQAALGRLISERAPRLGTLARCAIVDEGRKAVLALEGTDRNPRLDDVLGYLYHLGAREDVVMEWLRRREVHEDEASGLIGLEMELGLACASDTLRLADDAVSLHAGQVSMRLKQWLGLQLRSDRGSKAEPSLMKAGRVGLSDRDRGWREWVVPTVTVLRSNGWTVRISDAALHAMRTLLAEYAPCETGGILLGRVDFNRRTVYVVETLLPPADSVCTRFRFIRGSAGVRESHERSAKRTGDTIGYVAEWHTHPAGPPRPSRVDLKTAEETVQRFRQAHFPVVLVILTPETPIAVVKDPLTQHTAFI